MSEDLISSETAKKGQEEFGLYFVVGTPDPSDDEEVYLMAKEMRPKLTERLERMIPAALGPRHLLQRIEIWRGSARIVVYLTGNFTALSQYLDFVRSLETLMRQIEGLLRETIEAAGFPRVSMTSGWTNLTAMHPRQFEGFPAYRGLLRMTLAFLLLVLGNGLLLLLLHILFSHLMKMAVAVR